MKAQRGDHSPSRPERPAVFHDVWISEWSTLQASAQLSNHDPQPFGLGYSNVWPLWAGSMRVGASDSEFALTDYLKLLDWTARQLSRGRRGRTPAACQPILERLDLNRKSWCDLIQEFGRLFIHVAGRPQTIDETRSRAITAPTFVRALAQ